MAKDNRSSRHSADVLTGRRSAGGGVGGVGVVKPDRQTPIRGAIARDRLREAGDLSVELAELSAKRQSHHRPRRPQLLARPAPCRAMFRGPLRARRRARPRRGLHPPRRRAGPRGTAEQLEKRRRRAIALLHAGTSYREVAGQVGAAISSVVRWEQAYRRDKRNGLRARPIPGRPCRLLATQQRQLKAVLLRGAGAGTSPSCGRPSALATSSGSSSASATAPSASGRC